MKIYSLFLRRNSHIMNKSIGDKLKDLRKSRGFSLEEVIQQLNVSKSTYERMEKGDTSSWLTKIEQICNLYQIEPEELLLSEEKYVLISNKQKGGSTSSIVINNLSEKAIELYERMLSEKDRKIEDLENRLGK